MIYRCNCCRKFRTRLLDDSYHYSSHLGAESEQHARHIYNYSSLDTLTQDFSTTLTGYDMIFC